MKKHLLLLITISLLWSCSDDDITSSRTTTMRINHYQNTAMALDPVLSLLVQYDDNIGTENWNNLYATIDGFDYVPGNIYELSVRIDQIGNPAADAGSYEHTLLEVLAAQEVPAETEFDINLKLNDFVFVTTDSGYQVLNPDLVICNMDAKVSINMEITIDKGRGYVPAEENKKSGAPMGTIAVDSIFTPIKNVKYSIENFRVEQKTDYEKLVFEIVSDGSIHPKDALTEAAKVLIHHFMLFSDERITLEADEIAQTETYDEESLHMRQLLKTKLVDMDLSVRALNCLKAAEVDTLGDLVSFNKNDLMKFRNFGKKSLTELEELVINKGLSFGMDLSKYKLDKD